MRMNFVSTHIFVNMFDMENNDLLFNICFLFVSRGDRGWL